MKSSNLIDEVSYHSVINLSNEYGKKWDVIPEFGLKYTIIFNDACELDSKGQLTTYIKNIIREVFDSFDISNDYHC